MLTKLCFLRDRDFVRVKGAQTASTDEARTRLDAMPTIFISCIIRSLSLPLRCKIFGRRALALVSEARVLKTTYVWTAQSVPTNMQTVKCQTAEFPSILTNM